MLVLGRPVEGPGPDRGMVFQDYTSFDNRTVLDNVAFGLECAGVPAKERHEQAHAWIGKVGLDVKADAGKYPHQLSGGMRQRVAIARTLILKPRIILMDEPFGALDPAIRLNMQDLLIELWRDLEATVFFVTHSVEEAVHLGDRVYISLIDLNTMVRSAFEGAGRLDAVRLRGLKKQLRERQSQGLLEFIEPRWTLDMVVGHEPVKQRLREDAALLKRGQLHTLPMDYLVCGAVGTGKTFLAQCLAGEMGVPCVTLRNFRSKYVGETEGNLERVLSLLRAMGPVVVVVDEADAALGNRDQEGDSGTSSRVFSMIASQMGDTRYRGQILWMLLTCRPDLLPIDLKRQGRAEVHIPLFYPTEQADIRGLFLAMARKLGATLAPEDVPEVPQRGKLSGADIEGLVGRALRRSLLAGQDRLTREALAEVVAHFLPSMEGVEKELQETAAILECTDVQFLPHEIADKVAALGGRDKLQERYAMLRRLAELS